MPFCTNCGKWIDENNQFCTNCGTSAYVVASKKEEKRRTVYEGVVHKCPNCGEVLNSLMLTCPACGYEIRGSSSNSVQEFSMRLSLLDDERKKIAFIRGFLIPNTKEDIFDFMVLASTNIDSNIDDELSDAWQVIIKQAYQKAKLLFKNESELEEINSIYINTNEKLKKIKQVKSTRTFGTELTPVLSNLIVVAAWFLSIFILIPICGIKLDVPAMQSYPGVLWLLFIIGIFLIPPYVRCESSLPQLVTVLGLILSLVVLFYSCVKDIGSTQFSPYALLFVHAIICSIIILVRITKKKTKTKAKAKLNGLSFLIGLIVLVLFFVVYFISNLVVSLNGHTSTFKTFKWPKTGLATQVPKPTSEKGKITFNDDEEFWAEVEEYSVDEYEAYIEECKSKGFTIDSSKSGMGYEAYNKEGYHLDLSYTDFDCELDIEVQAPRAVGKLEWPTMGLALLVPTPNAEHGEVEIDTHIQLLVYVGDTSKEEYRAYVDSCIEKGFNVDHRRDDTIYDADDKDGNALWVEYEGNNIMRISLRSPND